MQNRIEGKEKAVNNLLQRGIEDRVKWAIGDRQLAIGIKVTLRSQFDM